MDKRSPIGKKSSTYRPIGCDENEQPKRNYVIEGIMVALTVASIAIVLYACYMYALAR